ncbi:MAG: hypothetical protein ABFS35_03855 [Bacteroidota bacterium]
MWTKEQKLKSITFYNTIIPIIFFELWNVLLAFIFIVFIETLIISLLTKLSFSKLFSVVLIANLITTIIGYLGQGILRMLIFIPISGLLGYIKFLDIIGGNLSLESYESKPGIPYELMINFSLSMIFAFIISVYFEKKHIDREFNDDEKITVKPILIANIISYVLLFFWILYRYLIIKNG